MLTYNILYIIVGVYVKITDLSSSRWDHMLMYNLLYISVGV